jgi:chitinase
MDVSYAFSDIENCDAYSLTWNCGGPAGERGYPDPIVSDPFQRSVDSEEISDELQSGESSEEPHALEKRVPGEATLSPKKVIACDLAFSLGGDDRYPAFPAMHSSPWDGIENGRWDSISRYWGNDSADCADWSISARRTADTKWASDQTGRRVRIRANYQS